ncbi:MAG: hypothetical protein ACOH1Y_18370 [Propionicimonas sp.]
MTNPSPTLSAGDQLTKLTKTTWAKANLPAVWDELLDARTWAGVDAVPGFRSPQTVIVDIQHWFRFSAPTPPESITPAVVRATYRTYGIRARLVLDAYIGGASARFADAYLSRRPDRVDVTTAWDRTLARTGITEPQAVGWAYTDLYRRDTPDPSITAWTTRFGPAAYLWVLAGYTLDEATKMRDAGTVVTDAQLRVMVALNGVTLSEGV